MSETEFERIDWFKKLVSVRRFSIDYIFYEIIRYLSTDQAKEFAEEFCRLNDIDFIFVLEFQGDWNKWKNLIQTTLKKLEKQLAYF